jgi:actin-like ATPase involved in cell morphogenesis
MGTTIGIDFGTSTTLIAVREGEQAPRIIPLGKRGATAWLPSVAAISPAGEVIIGEDAETSSEPVRSVKSKLTGKIEADSDVAVVDWISEIIKEALNRAITVSPEITGANEVFIGCPAEWDGDQRRALADAAAAAGITVDIGEIIDEPVAAGLAWIQDQWATSGAETQGRVVVFDAGGGTLDVAVLECEDQGIDNRRITVLSASSHPESGDAVDASIAQDILDKFDLSGEQTNDEILEASRRVKEGSSTSDPATVRLSIPGVKQDYSLSNSALAGLIDGQLTRASALVMSALRVAKLRGEKPLSVSEIRKLDEGSLRGEVDHVVLVGGLTRLHLVTEKISAMFPHSRVHIVANPQEMVALGLTYGKKLESLNLPRPPVNLNVVVGDQKEMIYGAFTPLYRPNDLYLFDTLAKHVEFPQIVNLGDSFLQCESPTRDKRALKMSIMVLHDEGVSPHLWWDEDNDWELVSPEDIIGNIDFLALYDQRIGERVYDEPNFSDIADFWRGRSQSESFARSIFVGTKFHLPSATTKGSLTINVDGTLIVSTAGAGQPGFYAKMKILFWPLKSLNQDETNESVANGPNPRVVMINSPKIDIPDSTYNIEDSKNARVNASERETYLSLDGLASFFSEAERLATEYYPIKSKPNFHGLTHLSIDTLLRDYELNEEEIADELIDCADETEIEYFEITEDDVPKVIFIRSVRGDLTARQQANHLSLMINKVKNLLERKTKRGITDPIERTRFAELQKVRKRDPEFVYILLALENRSSPIVSTEHLFNDVLRPGFDTAAVYGEDQIVEKYCAGDNESTTNTDVKFTISRDAFFSHSAFGANQLVQMVIGADEYVRETVRYGSQLFRLNPRLFLSKAAGPNKAMLSTLESDDVARFHILNNGVTGVCDELTISEAGESIQILVKNLQIVNGCQTTETLWSWARRAENTNRALVPLRIVESGNDVTLARQISATTNSQSAIAAADLVANDDLQKAMKIALEAFGIFYEARRGEWRQATQKQRAEIDGNNSFWTPGTKLKINLREMGQALLAVSGKPNQAKEQIAGLFKDQHRETYKTLFGESWVDKDQVALLAGLYLYIKDTKNWCDVASSTDYKKVASLGRFYIIYLIYEYWRKGNKAFVGEGRGQLQEHLLGAEQSTMFLNSFDTVGISKLANLAVKALIYTRENAVPQIDGNRALLRQGAHKEAIEDRFGLLVDAQL